MSHIQSHYAEWVGAVHFERQRLIGDIVATAALALVRFVRRAFAAPAATPSAAGRGDPRTALVAFDPGR